MLDFEAIGFSTCYYLNKFSLKRFREFADDGQLIEKKILVFFILYSNILCLLFLYYIDSRKIIIAIVFRPLFWNCINFFHSRFAYASNPFKCKCKTAVDVQFILTCYRVITQYCCIVSWEKKYLNQFEQTLFFFKSVKHPFAIASVICSPRT